MIQQFPPTAQVRHRLADRGLRRWSTAMVAMLAATPLFAGPNRADDQPPATALAGIDTPGDPSFTPPSAADSPAEPSGPFDAVRGDIGEDDDISEEEKRRRAAKSARSERRKRRATGEPSPADRIPNPLAGTPQIDPATTGKDAETILASLLPHRSDTPFDWFAPLECLHGPGEPRALPPCVPGPPCHPSLPPHPYDLVGMRGEPSCGPIYGGPCAPRTGSHDHCPHPHLHRLCDRLFDAFYKTK
jgi:hypothetical protein